MAAPFRIGIAMCLAVTVVSISAQGQQKSSAIRTGARCHARILVLDGIEAKFAEKPLRN